MKNNSQDISKLPKWAQIAWADRENELRLARALVWPTMPNPAAVNTEDVLRGAKTGVMFIGWNAHTNNCEFRVEQGCSGGVFHSVGRIDQTERQGAGTFYHTKAEALLQCRWELCRRFAYSLSRLDQQMETAKDAEPSRLGMSKRGY